PPRDRGRSQQASCLLRVPISSFHNRQPFQRPGDPLQIFLLLIPAQRLLVKLHRLDWNPEVKKCAAQIVTHAVKAPDAADLQQQLYALAECRAGVFIVALLVKHDTQLMKRYGQVLSMTLPRQKGHAFVQIRLSAFEVSLATGCEPEVPQ